jgi:hypothetical protein
LVDNAESRRERLDFLMKKHGLTSRQVGHLIHRDPGHVRQYRCGLKEFPACLLRLLELEIEHEHGIERAQQGAR